MGEGKGEREGGRESQREREGKKKERKEGEGKEGVREGFCYWLELYVCASQLEEEIRDLEKSLLGESTVEAQPVHEKEGANVPNC